MAAADVSQEQPFRFLDLFPEVRNRIYTIVVAGSYDLTNFATPAIARASQQLRAEVLPVLFAEGDFHVKMVSNITDRKATRDGHEWGKGGKRKRKPMPAGTLGQKQPVKQLIRSAGENALFKKIIFEVQDAELTMHPRFISRNLLRRFNFPLELPAGQVVFTIGLQARGSAGLVVSVDKRPLLPMGGRVPAEPNILGPGGYRMTDFEEQDIDAVVEVVEGVAQGFATREGSVGFSLSELEALARSFRYAP